MGLSMSNSHRSYVWPWRNRLLKLPIKIFPNHPWAMRRMKLRTWLAFLIFQKIPYLHQCQCFFLLWRDHNRKKKTCLFFFNKVCHSLWRRPNAGNFSFRDSLRWSIYIINSVDKNQISFNFSPPKQQHSFFRTLPSLMKLARAWKNNVLNNREHKAVKLSSYSKYDYRNSYKIQFLCINPRTSLQWY